MPFACVRFCLAYFYTTTPAVTSLNHSQVLRAKRFIYFAFKLELKHFWLHVITAKRLKVLENTNSAHSMHSSETIIVKWCSWLARTEERLIEKKNGFWWKILFREYLWKELKMFKKHVQQIPS